MPRKLTPESSLKKLICDWLDAEKIPYWRMQSGATVGTYKGKSRFIRFGEKGMADLLIVQDYTLCNDCWSGGRAFRVIWAELKAGTKQSEDQYLFQQYVESLGMTYVIVRSLGDLHKALTG